MFCKQSNIGKQHTQHGNATFRGDHLNPYDPQDEKAIAKSVDDAVKTLEQLLVMRRLTDSIDNMLNGMGKK